MRRRTLCLIFSLFSAFAFADAAASTKTIDKIRHHGRETQFAVYYPSSGKVEGVAVAAHNWGGHYCDGVADPSVVAETLNVVFVCVEYYQSGWTLKDGPYDFGVKASQDVIAVTRLLKARIASPRWVLVGASGGGHVALMTYKRQPTWFSRLVLMASLTRLTEDIALGRPGGSPLDAGWGTVTQTDLDARDMTKRSVWDSIRQRGGRAEITLIHSLDDPIAPVRGVELLAGNAARAGANITTEWLDGLGHGLGDRTAIVLGELAE